MTRSIWRSRAVGLLGALIGPALMTLILLLVNLGHATDYVFLYLGLVAILAITSGLISALLLSDPASNSVDPAGSRCRETIF